MAHPSLMSTIRDILSKLPVYCRIIGALLNIPLNRATLFASKSKQDHRYLPDTHKFN